MLPVAVHVPDVCAVVVVADIPVFKTGFLKEFVADLLDPTKARQAPIEQRTKPIKTGGLKKADREVEFVFIEVIFFFALFLFIAIGGRDVLRRKETSESSVSLRSGIRTTKDRDALAGLSIIP
jgi:hypothetical protein